ncbi:hypothetical protein CK203_112185 [Vitis vinifera]|uniref:Uncharacterized protein n=1 Tax=Vitis vinifera TaxID=29760 RepID=A0A438CSG1_VITVI|nr:hypothetical protein CK203_112185 [Vitis vinifera]
MKGEESSSKSEQGSKTKEAEQETSGIPNGHLPPFRPWQRLEEAFLAPHPHRHLDHIEPPWEPHPRHLFRPRPFPHLRGKLLLSADTPTRRPPTEPVPPAEQATSPVSRPPAKRTKFSGPGESSHAPQAEPPTEETQIPVENTPETIIRRPMIADHR